ncbi:MAG: polysaccharide pyruvyl transferase family protein [Paludibacteraceae bacterium]|nr:polysaccharide pyruvyl transferase family protein [Paludibacteraceae bacterium]
MALSVGILTMHRVHNCGSFLQAYALQTAIERLGHKAEVIDYRYPNLYHYEQLGYNPKHYQYSWRAMLHHFRHGRIQEAKEMLFHLHFDRYIERHLHLSKPFHTMESLQQNPPHYDVYCLGSDQTLNPNYIFQDTSFMLGFAPEGAKKISYASSMTIPELNEHQSAFYKEHLKDFTSISVRESSGTKVLGGLLNCQGIQTVLDPVFLLSANEWQKRFHFRQKRKNYIFYYVLNYMAEVKADTEKQLNDAMSTGKYDGVIRVGGNKHVFPRDFIRLIANAGLVITDSFHASAFSLIFDTPLLPVIGKGSKDDRIKDLLHRTIENDGILTEVEHAKQYLQKNVSK